jgi:hypothetical protein
MSVRVSRNQVVAMFGTPDRTEGSLNSPIEREDKGVHFNEKWIYDHLDADPSGAAMRTVYWHRYDFTGTRICSSVNEEWRDDPALGDALAAVADRLAPVPDNNLPVTPHPYREVSKAKDAADLGGYRQNYERP